MTENEDPVAFQGRLDSTRCNRAHAAVADWTRQPCDASRPHSLDEWQGGVGWKRLDVEGGVGRRGTTMQGQTVAVGCRRGLGKNPWPACWGLGGRCAGAAAAE